MYTLTSRRALGCITMALMLLLYGDAARAQDLDDVTISGQVFDESGAVVAGAGVAAISTTNAFERTATTDAQGRYRIIELPPGTYTLRAACNGFAAVEKSPLTTLAGASLRVDFTLRPAGVQLEQTITSETGAPLVDATRTIVGGSIVRRELERLPAFTRSPLDFVFTLPNVTEEPLSVRDVAEDRDARGRTSIERAAATPEEAGSFALAGGTSYSNNITVDGLDNNDDREARERFQPSLEAIEEVQVVTNQFAAEYGRASGGRVNLRTRSGTADLHARLFYFFRDESLNANTYNNRRRGLKRLPLQEHNPGFTFSAPLIFPHAAPRDGARPRTFIFTSYELDTLLDSTTIDALVPVEASALFPLPPPTTLAGRRREAATSATREPAELAPFVEKVSTPSRRHILTSRVDQKFSEMHNGAFLFQFGRSANSRQSGGGLRLREALQARLRHTEALSYSDNLVFSPKLVNQLRAQVSSLRPHVQAHGQTSGTARPVVLININDPLEAGDAADRSGTLIAGASSAGASERREMRWQLQDTLTIVRGAHTLKLGADTQLVRATFVDLTDASGTYSFTSAADFLAAAPSRFRQRFNTASVQRNLYTGFFVQDEWRAGERLTLSFGLRYENESIVRDRNNFAPRLGVAFDPFGSGRTVLRFGAGLFFNRALLRTLDDFTLGAQTIEFDTNNLPASERRAFLAAHLSFPQTLQPDSPLLREFGLRQLDFSRRLDPDLRIPESFQLNTGFERQLRGGLAFEINYTFNRGIHLWREFNANAPVLPRGFTDFAAYLLSRDFANFRRADGTRPLYNTSTAGELVRFTVAPPTDGIGRITEFGVPVSVFNLASVSSTTTLETALAALDKLRPDPARGQLEQLASIGNSFYHALTLEVRRRFHDRASGFGFSFRTGYTLSRLIDDGVVNTSSALNVGDFRRERARSLLDRRHRFVFSGTLDAPRRFGGLSLAAILRLASGAPFNISIGGADRNLDDVGNDRPDFNGDLSAIRFRAPAAPLDARLLEAFSLPLIGRTGNLPRNAGRGPGLFAFDLNITREFRVGPSARLRPTVEIENVLNHTTHTFGAEFINFSALGPGATDAQRQAFHQSFLVPTRTLRPRSLRLGVRFDF